MTSPIGQEMGSILLAPHQLAHFWNCDSYVLEDFSLYDESMSSVASSESCWCLYLCLRYSTRLAGAEGLVSPGGVLVGLDCPPSGATWEGPHTFPATPGTKVEISKLGLLG